MLARELGEPYREYMARTDAADPGRLVSCAVNGTDEHTRAITIMDAWSGSDRT